MSAAYAELAKAKMPNGQLFGGRYYSLTPGHPDKISDAEYKKLIDEHLMFKVRGSGSGLKLRLQGLRVGWRQAARTTQAQAAP